MAAPIKLLYGFFCEHLRTEAGGQTTAIGLWGTECRLQSDPPFLLRSLSFHAYLENPDQAPLNGHATFDIPGMGISPVIPIKMEGQGGMVGNNINLAVGPILIPHSGTVKVCLHMDADPPLDQEFTLRINFMPPAPRVETEASQLKA
jgi:hypothetical protein